MPEIKVNKLKWPYVRLPRDIKALIEMAASNENETEAYIIEAAIRQCFPELVKVQKSKRRIGNAD